MPRSNQSLLQQLRVTPFGLRQRQALFHLTEKDCSALNRARPFVEPHYGEIVERFYEVQLTIPEVSHLIGDAESLRRVKRALHRYVAELFAGTVDMPYINGRLRIGLVHKRIGVEPMYYLSAVQSLKTLTVEAIHRHVPQTAGLEEIEESLKKLIFFDVSLVFDTYISSVLDEIRTEREKTEQYARDLEEQVRIRTEQLVERSRTDALTGLYNTRHLKDSLNRSLYAAERRGELLCFAFIDLDGFKQINDTHGHSRGDEVLRAVADALLACVRKEDSCFRYGGDEFCVVLPRCDAAQAREILADRVQEHIDASSLGLKVAYSVGIVEAAPGEFAEADQMIQRADEEMYRLKGGKTGGGSATDPYPFANVRKD